MHRQMRGMQWKLSKAWNKIIKILGSSAVHGKTFLATIISKNIWTLKAASDQAAGRTWYAYTLLWAA